MPEPIAVAILTAEGLRPYVPGGSVPDPMSAGLKNQRVLSLLYREEKRRVVVRYADGSYDVMENVPMIVRFEGELIRCEECKNPVDETGPRRVGLMTVCADCAAKFAHQLPRE